MIVTRKSSLTQLNKKVHLLLFLLAGKLLFAFFESMLGPQEPLDHGYSSLAHTFGDDKFLIVLFHGT